MLLLDVKNYTSVFLANRLMMLSTAFKNSLPMRPFLKPDVLGCIGLGNSYNMLVGSQIKCVLSCS